MHRAVHADAAASQFRLLFRRLTSFALHVWVLYQAESGVPISAAQPLPPARVLFCLGKHNCIIAFGIVHIGQQDLQRLTRSSAETLPARAR